MKKQNMQSRPEIGGFALQTRVAAGCGPPGRGTDANFTWVALASSRMIRGATWNRAQRFKSLVPSSPAALSVEYSRNAIPEMKRECQDMPEGLGIHSCFEKVREQVWSK